MKRLLGILLCLTLLLPLSGCGENSYQTPGNFYYYRPGAAENAEEIAIVPEQRELAGMSGDIEALLYAYLSGPESKDLESLIPRDTKLVAWQVSGNTLYLNFSEDFAALSGVELSVACACVAKTFLELVPVENVRIRANDALLDGEKAITLSESSLSLYDDSVDQLHSVLTVYYSDQPGRYLIGQELSINLAAQEDVIPLLIEALTEPAEDSGLVSALPRGTKLLNYSINDGLCTVNFSAEFESNASSRCEAQRLSLMCVVNTLCQLEDIDQVEFCIEDNLLVQYGLLSIPAPLVWEEGIIGPVRTGVNEFDATLYLSNGSEQYLTPVPTRIRQSSGISQAEMVIRALVDYTPANGFSGTVPSETRVNSAAIVNQICYIDLSADFLSSNQNIPLSVHSIVASVCALEGISKVQITIENTSPGGDLAEYFLPLSPSPDWFV